MLAMTRPFKHPKTGFYWIRKRVPLDLQALVGKREEKLSLRTRDLNEAKKAASRMLIEIEERWASLRKGSQALSDREAHALAEEVFRSVLMHHFHDADLLSEWDTEIGGELWKAPSLEDVDWSAGDRMLAQFVPSKPFERARMVASCERTADALLLRRGLKVDATSRQRLVQAIASAMQQASLEVRAANKPIFGGKQASEPSAPTWRSMGETSRPAPSSISLSELYDGWEKESSSTERTRYAWKRVVRDLVCHLGHDRASDIKQTDLVSWKNSLLEDKLASKTIKDGKLAPIRAILEWGVKNGKLEVNVATNRLLKKASRRHWRIVIQSLCRGG